LAAFGEVEPFEELGVVGYDFFGPEDHEETEN